jgi:hypothetical protein
VPYKDRETMLAARSRDREKKNERDRKRYARTRAYRQEYAREAQARGRHGPRAAEAWADLWEKQRGLCYLCGEELTAGDTHLDHDHRCCPKMRSCQICRRGLAHNNCNVAIGYAGDSAARLRRMADALEAAQEAFESRRADADRQLLLIE